VEKKKALRQAKEAMRTTGTPASKDDRKKDGQGKKNLDNTRKGKEIQEPWHEEA